MILAQRMPYPGRRKQEAPQVRMALEADAEEIPDLPLVPVRCGPDIGDGRQRGRVPRERHLEADVLIVREGQQLVDDGKIALRLPLAMAADSLVDGGEVIEHRIGPRHL